uniref:Uncharacterized protein n=1 Tax=Geoglobus ahangari TaxID=113653 RepID=A0A7C3UDT4_9EURY
MAEMSISQTTLKRKRKINIGFCKDISAMRRFNWRLFRRKGLKKEISKDEKLLLKNVNDLKTQKEEKDIHEVAREILPEED